MKEEFLSIMTTANWYQLDQGAYGWIFTNYEYLFLVTYQKYLTKECWRWLKISVCYNCYKSLNHETISGLNTYPEKCPDREIFTEMCYIWQRIRLWCKDHNLLHVSLEVHLYESWKIIFSELQYCHIGLVVLFQLHWLNNASWYSELNW